MKFRKTHRQDGPHFYKDEINHVYGLEFDTEADRDTAAKMIEAMAWQHASGADVREMLELLNAARDRLPPGPDAFRDKIDALMRKIGGGE